MQIKTLFQKQILLPAIALTLLVGLVSFGTKQINQKAKKQIENPNDTVPPKKKKPVDLDATLAELDKLDISAEMEKATAEIKKALEEIDTQKMKVDLQKALESIEWEKIQAQTQVALAGIDFIKMQQEIKQAMASINKEAMQKELEKIKKIDFSNIKKEMKKIKPEIEATLQKAKLKIEKAKATIKEHQQFADLLQADGLLNKKDGYSIRHKDGELFINDKKVSDQVYTKYKSFLDQHKNFNYSTNKEDENINID